MSDDSVYKILKKAQETYGYPNQVTVATEELCELAAILSKYPRYPDHNTACEHIRDRIIEEYADVIIVLHHLQMMFEITENELNVAASIKLERLARWLNSSPDFYQTTVDRAVGDKP